MSVTQQVLPSNQLPVSSVDDGDLDQLCINTIRTLSMDAVQQAKSGHPGTPMALAPLVYTIWNRAMTFDPQDPLWPNRDRFVLSNGHASMLLWSMLHLTRTKAVNAPDRSAKVWRPASAWRSPRNGSPIATTVPAARSSTTESTPSAAMDA